jgi:hypothetical protein
MLKILIGVLVFCIGGALQAAEKENTDLKLAGGVIVPTPAEGYQWKVVREIDDGKTKVQIYAATKEGSAAKVVLIFEQTTADTDGKRIARIKGDYNGMVSSLQDAGYTDLAGDKPPLETPVKDRVEFAFAGKDKEGKAAAFRSIIVFGKSVYHFQISAGTEDEAKKMAKVAESVKE